MQANYNLKYALLISFVATIGGFLFGFDSGVINGTYDGLNAAFGSGGVNSFKIASMLLGCAAGAFFAGTLADKFGRRSLLIVSALLFIVSAWGSGIATGASEFIIYRIIGGLAVGAASVLAPAYISEIAPADIRGRMTTIQQVAIISGLFFAFLSNYYLADIAGASTATFWLGYETWRWMFWMELVPAALFFVFLLVIPESPRFLVASKQDEKAVNILGKIFSTQRAIEIRDEIKQSLKSDHRPSLKDLVSEGRIRPIVWIGIGLAVFQQFVGINIVFYYGAYLWQSVGFTEADALKQNVIGGGLSIAAVLVSLAIVDKIGRKPLLWVGSTGMTITLAILVFCFASATFENDSLVMGPTIGTLALYSANAYVIFFNVSWGPVMWVMLGEMFPNQIRGSGLAIAGLAQWLANFLVVWSFEQMLGGIGLAGTYALYAVSAFLSIFFVIKFVRETKGRTLEEMQG